MIEIRIHEINDIFSKYALKADRLYFSAFPRIERHSLVELHGAASKDRADYLAFTDEGDGNPVPKFLGLAYVIVRGDVAFLLYFAIAQRLRNSGYGAAILDLLQKKYEGLDLVLLIESLEQKCNNMEIRKRRKQFYLANGMRETGLTQLTSGNEAIYEILNHRENFDLEAYKAMIADYPFKSSLEDVVETKSL